MRIVGLEDDESFWDLLQEAIEREFPGVDLTWLRSEADFCAEFAGFIEKPPDVFLLDVMVKWANAAETMPVPPTDVKQQGYYRAGLRCRNRLLMHPATATLPVILYTVLERADVEIVGSGLPPGTVYVRKDVEFENLFAALRRLAQRAIQRP
jgi:hypothetical protein